jgi:hypothetical protein
MPRWLAVVLCGLGAALVVFGLRQAGRGRDTRDWTRATGLVLRSQVEELDGPREQGWPRYRPAIRYRYQARGAVHESEAVLAGSGGMPASGDRGEPQRWVDRFPEGSEVEVWFDPADPTRAVLVRGVPASQVAIAIAAGIVVAGIGLFALSRS